MGGWRRRVWLRRSGSKKGIWGGWVGGKKSVMRVLSAVWMIIDRRRGEWGRE